jgi:hypothetical protein
MIHLFKEDKKEDWTELAADYDIEISNLLRPVFDRAKAQGHSLRDLQYIVNMAVVELALSRLMGWDGNK